MNRLTEYKGVPNSIGQANLVIVGEAPGQDEMLYKRPFKGPSGQLLDSWLTLQGIPRSSLFITNVIGDRISKIVTKEDKDALHAELRIVQPKAVLAVGDIAMNALLGIKGITKWRGSVFYNYSLKCKVIPCIHPAGVFRKWEFWPLSASDVGKLKNLEYHNNEKDWNFIPEATETDFFHHFGIINTDHICVDVETLYSEETGYYSILSRIGIGTEDIVLSIPVRNLTIPLLKGLRYLLSRRDIIKIAHNASYDWKIIAHCLKFLPSRPWFDTMIAWHSLQPELPKKLEVVTSLNMETVNWKDKKHEDMGKYNCIDIWHTIKLYKKLFPKVVNESSFKHMMTLIEPVIYMEMRGMKIDTVLRSKKVREFEEQYNTLVSAMPCNPHSPKQVAEYLYEELGLPKKYKRKTGNVTTDDKALKDLQEKYPEVPQLKAIILCRHLRKMKSTYFEIPLHKGRMLPSVNITGAETGRFSSDLHSFPKAHADVVVADEGCVLIEPDLSQADARAVAWISGDVEMMNLFLSGKDIHEEVGKMIGVDRDTAKPIEHGANYCIGANTIAITVKCSVSKAKMKLAEYYARFPSIQRWHDRVINQIKASRTITTALGRKRIFYGRFGDALWREAIAFEPQSIASGDNMNIGLRRLYDLGFDILFAKHDSVLLQVPEPLTQETVDVIKEALAIKMDIHGRELIIPVDVSWGKNWKAEKLGGDMKEWKDNL